ncbi:MAG: hypothetical protein COA78_33425 [Blastopirellula sp.]|nr:MAG: hypothetical protein COA78_33425 [Blastopirellula sp.]
MDEGDDKKITAIALSATCCNTQLSAADIVNKPWLSWLAELMGFHSSTSKVLTFNLNPSKVTSAFIYSQTHGITKGFILMMCGNHLLKPEYLEKITGVLL